MADRILWHLRRMLGKTRGLVKDNTVEYKQYSYVQYYDHDKNFIKKRMTGAT